MAILGDQRKIAGYYNDPATAFSRFKRKQFLWNRRARRIREARSKGDITTELRIAGEKPPR